MRACIAGDGTGESTFALVVDAAETDVSRRCLKTLVAVADRPRTDAAIAAAGT